MTTSIQIPILNVDINNNCESVVMEWDFTSRLGTGESLTGTPTILAIPSSPAANFSSITVSSPLVLARVTITPPAQSGIGYNTTCTVTTSQGNTLIGTGQFSTSAQLDSSNNAYTTPQAVQALLGPQNYDGQQDLNQFIYSANILTQNIVAFANDSDQDIIPNSTDLEMVERWLAAHFYLQNNPARQSLSTNSVSMSFQGQSGQRISSTRYGQAAIALDFTGYLHMIDQRAVVRANWLGRGHGPQGVSGTFGTVN